MSEDFPGLAGFRAGSVLAGYRLEAQVGAGGMAVVFRARDQRLDRLVALKILAPALAADAAFRRRFIAESRAAAAVDDPHVIPVHEAGEASGVLFIAMRFVTGGDLRRVLEREGPLAPGRAAGFISPVASALDAAHRAGLVHRDIKPANILVDASPDRPDHVYLSDFGVSKGALSSVSLTGQFVGTPHYSAPEQIQGRAVDGRADQYALACVAWQLLTGQVPFERDQPMAVLLAHLSEPPPSLAERRPDLPAEAGQVLARALAKAPGERYGSCREFADALRAALGLPPYTTPGTPAPGHPRTEISAPPALPEPVAVATGTAPKPADAPAATHDSLPVTAGALSPPAAAVGQAGGLAPDPGGLALELDTVTAAADRLPGTADVPAAGQSVRAGPGPGADGAQPTRRPRGRFIVIALTCAILAAAVIVALVLAMPGAPRASGHSHAAAKTPGATRAPSGPFTGQLTDPEPGSIVNAVAFAPGGTTLATGDLNGNVYLWNTATGGLTATLTDSARHVALFAVAFRPGSTTLAAAGTTISNSGHYSGSVYLWDTATGELTTTLTSPASNYMYSVAFGPGGTTLAAGGNNSSISLWDTTTGKLTTTLTDPSSVQVNSVAFGPGGTTLAAGAQNGSTYLWNTTTRTIIATLPDPDGQEVNSVAFGPGGTTLAAGDSNGSTYLWDIATRTIIATLTGPSSGGVFSVVFGPGGTTLAAGDYNGNVYLWDIATRTIIVTLTDPTVQHVRSVAFGPGDTTLAASDYNGSSTYIWSITKYNP